MPPNLQKDAIATAQTSPKKPRTQVEALRELLRDLELRLARLKESRAGEAMQIPLLLDQAAALLESLHKAGLAAGSEDSYFETITALLYSKRRLFLERVGGAAALERAYPEHQPPTDHWWWHVSEAIAQERRAALRRALAVAGAAALLLFVFAGLYQRFWAPDPALQASVEHQQIAENMLLAGRYEEALAEVREALQAAPDNPMLQVLQGVIYEVLEQSKLAAESFELAEEGYTARDAFLSARAGYYLMANQPTLALADAQAAIALDPDSAIGFLRAAQAYEALGDIAHALEYYQFASDVAERVGDAQLLVIARMSLGQLLQSPLSLTATPAGPP